MHRLSRLGVIIIRTNEYFDNDVKLKSRIFYAMAITGCFANTFGFIANAIIFGFTSGTIICGICDIIVLSSFILGIATHHINVAMWIILLLINYFEFPFLYVLYGKDTFIYTILGLIAILLYTNTKQRYFFVSAAFVADIAAIILRQRHPELNQATHDMTGSLIASYTIAFGAACALMNIYISQHRKQNELLTNLSNQLIETAHTDALTQVYNRRYLMEYLEEKQNSAEAYNGCALLTDLDFSNP